MQDIETLLLHKLSNLPKVTGETLCSLKEISQMAILRSHVFRLENNFFVFKEVQFATVKQLNLMFDQLKRLSHGQKKWFLLVDLRDATTPTTEVRAHLKTCYIELAQSGLCFVVLLVGSRVIEFAVKLVGAKGIPVPYYCSYSLSKSIQKLLSVREIHQTVHVGLTLSPPTFGGSPNSVTPDHPKG